MIGLNPIQNGIHSLAEGLRAFHTFHNDPKNVFAMKDSILRSHHAIETLFKHFLYGMNPALLISKDRKIDEFLNGYEKWSQGLIATPIDEMRTVNLEKTIRRLERFGFFRTTNKRDLEIMLEAVNKLSFYRNRLQHFSLSADPEMVGRILGNVIPKAFDILSFFFQNPISRSYPPIDLSKELAKLYSEALDTINLLRNNYDQLVQDTIKFFSGNTFKDQILNLKIKDYGKVGAPPYVPDIASEGFLAFTHDRLSTFRSLRKWTTKGETPYSGKIAISQPKFEPGKTSPDFGIAEGSLEFDGQLIYTRADQFLILPEAEQKTAVLRGIKVTIRAHLTYRTDALMTQHHFDCRKILGAKGQLIVRIFAIPKGYKSEEVEINGTYQTNLDENNAPFRLHSFREPDGSLKENWTLEWNINTKGDVSFQSTP